MVHLERGRTERERTERRRARRLRAARAFALALALLLSAPVTRAAEESSAPAGAAADPATPLPRLVSLNPSLSSILVRLGASDALVGVDDYSARVEPSLAERPRVGGLFDPNVEAVVALEPDRVLLVAGVDQEAHAARLRRVGLEVDVLPNERLDEVLANIERLGRLVGREADAKFRVERIEITWQAVKHATRKRDKPRTVAVVDRSPLFLVGGDTFLDDMLEAAGADNVVRTLGDGYPRASMEWLIAAKPALVLDMTPDGDAAKAFWSRWPSLPAVASDRVIGVEASRVSLPGPDLHLALRELAELVHGAEIVPAIENAVTLFHGEKILGPHP